MPDDHDSASPEFYLDQALATFEEVRELVDRSDQPGLFGIVMHDIAQVHEFAGRRTDAAECYREAVEAKRAAENPADLQTSLVSLASCLIAVGELAQAREAVDEAAELLARGMDITTGSRAFRINEVGSLYESLGDQDQRGAYARAADSYAWALDLLDPEQDPGSCGHVLLSLGRVHKLLGHLSDAADAYVQAARLLRAAGEDLWLTHALIDLGRVYRLLAERAASRPPRPGSDGDTADGPGPGSRTEETDREAGAAGPGDDAAGTPVSGTAETATVPEPRESHAATGSGTPA